MSDIPATQSMVRWMAALSEAKFRAGVYDPPLAMSDAELNKYAEEIIEETWPTV